jgi:hypothetical protein
MPPKPAAIAAPPSTASPASWNPAVPPPPVFGAPAGGDVWASAGLSAGLGEDESLALPDADGLAEEPGLVLEPALAPPVTFGETPPPAEALVLVLELALALELAELPELAVGGNTDTDGELPPVHADSATQASTVIRPQPTLSLTLCAVHAIAVRAVAGGPGQLNTVIGPPRAYGKTISRSPAAETGAGRGNA